MSDYQQDTLAQDLNAAGALDGTENALIVQNEELVAVGLPSIKTYFDTLGYPYRVATIATGANHAPNASTTDIYKITFLDVNTSIDPPSGTPADGQRLRFIITSDPGVRTFTFNAIYRFSTSLAAPASTTASKTIYLDFVYNLVVNKWDCVLKLDNF